MAKDDNEPLKDEAAKREEWRGEEGEPAKAPWGGQTSPAREGADGDSASPHRCPPAG